MNPIGLVESNAYTSFEREFESERERERNRDHVSMHKKVITSIKSRILPHGVHKLSSGVHRSRLLSAPLP